MENREEQNLENYKIFNAIQQRIGYGNTFGAAKEYSDQQNKQLLDEIELLKSELDNIKIESSHEIADLLKTQQETQKQLDYTFHQLEGSIKHVEQLQSELKDKERVNEELSKASDNFMKEAVTLKDYVIDMGFIDWEDDSIDGCKEFDKALDELSNLTNQNK